jgi:hypothetical protein
VVVVTGVATASGRGVLHGAIGAFDLPTRVVRYGHGRQRRLPAHRVQRVGLNTARVVGPAVAGVVVAMWRARAGAS